MPHGRRRAKGEASVKRPRKLVSALVGPDPDKFSADRWYEPIDFELLLKTSRTTVLREIHDGRLKAFRLGRRKWRIRGDWAKQYLDSVGVKGAS